MDTFWRMCRYTKPFHVLFVSLAVLCFQSGAQQPASPSSQQQCAGFLHGVASGDPKPDSIIIWTRYTPQDNSSTTQVQWFMSTSVNATPAQAQFNGSTSASPESDFTVKVDVRGLTPGTRYFYFFQSGNFSSLLGTTKTAPDPTTNATIRCLRCISSPVPYGMFAQMSCASWRWGYFNVYNMTSRVLDLDVIVFLGDWIYEYSDQQYPASGQGVSGRAPLQPGNELATLEDYRTRHRWFHTDPSLVEMMRRAPIIAIWDDHDVAADNAYRNGSENPVQGVTYANRKCNGVQAYHEYMPIRSPNSSVPSAGNSSSFVYGNASSGSSSGANDSAVCGGLADIYRTFQFGRTMTLVMLEERILARDQQYNYSTDPYIQALKNHAPDEWSNLPDLQQKRASYYQALVAPNRTLIGQTQMDRLRSDFSSSSQSGVTWQVLGNTVVMGPLNTPDVEAAVQQQGFIAQTLLDGVLNVATSDLLEVVPASFGDSGRVLVGTGRYHDPVIVDGWSGYQFERNQIFTILDGSANNPVVLSGDIHNAFVWRLIPDNATTPVAIEFTTASVTPPGVDQLAEKLPGDVPTLLTVAEQGLHISNNKTMHFSNIKQRGAVYHTVNSSLWHADYSFVDTEDQPNSSFACQAAFQLLAGQAREVRNASCTPTAQLFFQLHGPGDPLNASAAGVPDHTTAAVQGTRLSSCPTARLEQTDRQPGDGSNSSQGGDAGNTGMVGLAVQFPTSGTKCCVVGGLARVSVVVLLAPFLLSCMSLLSM